MTSQIHPQPDLPLHLVRDLIDRHGVWAVFRAALQPRPPDPGMLNNHLRRDIGLAPQAPAPRWQDRIW